jgi:acylphosphatase
VGRETVARRMTGELAIRKTIFVAGRVQGVGFRYTTHAVAQSHPVFGFVENLEDGRVKIVVEAESQEIDRFMESVKTQMAGKIKSIEQYSSEASGEFADFSIKRS